MNRAAALAPLCLALAALLGSAVSPARADEGRVTVVGRGEVEAPADVLEIVLTVGEEADELAECRDRFSRRVDGLRAAVEQVAGGEANAEPEQGEVPGGGETGPGAAALDLEASWSPEQVDSGGKSAIPDNQANAIRRMGGAVPQTARFTIRQRLTLRIRGVDSLDDAGRKAFDRLIDKLVERGADDGGGGAPPVFRYVCSDEAALRAKALKAAVEDARAQASQLAELCGRVMGAAVRIRDVTEPDEDERGDAASNPDAGAANNAALALQLARLGLPMQPDPEKSSSRVRVSKSIEIEFELR